MLITYNNIDYIKIHNIITNNTNIWGAGFTHGNFSRTGRFALLLNRRAFAAITRKFYVRF